MATQRRYKNLAAAGSEYSRYLPEKGEGFRGLSAGGGSEEGLLAAAENMWRDPENPEGGALVTVPGYRRLFSFEGEVHGIHRAPPEWGECGEENPLLFLHAGRVLYRVVGEEEPHAVGALSDAPSVSFFMNGALYLLDGTGYFCLKKRGEEYVLSPVSLDATVPLVAKDGLAVNPCNHLTGLFSQRERALGERVLDTYLSEKEFGTENGRYRYMGSSPFLQTDSIVLDMGEYKGSEARVISWAPRNHVGPETDPFQSVSAEDATGGVDSAITAVAISPRNMEGNYPIALYGGVFGGLSALRHLYFGGDTSERGGVYTLGEEGDTSLTRMGVPLTLHFGFSAREMERYFSDLPHFLRVLPPNAVLSPGESILLDGGGSITAGEYAAPQTMSDGVVVTKHLPSAPEADKIYLTEGEGGYRITCGSGVTVGKRAYLYGQIPDENGRLLHTVCIRIYVKGEGEEMTPSADVFDDGALPLAFPPFLPASGILSAVREGREEVASHLINRRGEVECAVVLTPPDEGELTLTFEGVQELFFSEGECADGAKDGVPPLALISGCRHAAVFEGRVFLSGNPAFPAHVFYSAENDAAYFPSGSHLFEGGGATTGLLPADGVLLILKRERILFATGRESAASPMGRVYETERGVLGVGSAGAACSFFDDAVVLTDKGVYGLDRESFTLSRTMGSRSRRIESLLLSEPREGAFMVEWCGYLCLFVGNRVYLADSRTAFNDGGRQYEWLLLTGVGGSEAPFLYRTVTGALCFGEYTEEEGLFVRQGEALLPLGVAEREESIPPDEVFSAPVFASDGKTLVAESVLFTKKGELCLPVTKSAERMEEGELLPPRYPTSVAGRLYFAAGNVLYLFNTDKRGKPFSENGVITEVPKGALHPGWYSFDGRPIRSFFVTARDDCGIPHLKKSTAHGGLVLHAAVMDGGAFSLSVRTDRESVWREIDRFTTSPAHFGGTDFSSLRFGGEGRAILGCKERERGWAEKQYRLSDGGFCHPFGIYTLSYRYTVAGKIKS